MIFRTEYTPAPSALRLDPRRGAVLAGSCFSDNIGAMMRRSLWDACVNPCGTLFNPFSIARTLRMAVGAETFDAGRCFESDGIWRHWDFPTRFTGTTRRSCAESCAAALLRLRDALACAGTLAVTFGTSFVYRLSGDEGGRIVANCHKMPASRFVREMAATQATVEEWLPLLDILAGFNPDLKVIFTVSPVRHVRDGFVENSRSKARLLLACELLAASRDTVDYFPAWEIMNDDLRDYRFYAGDLVHPSEEGAAYIWEKFRATYLDSGGQALLTEGEALRRRVSHRHLNPDSPKARAFDTETRRMAEAFAAANPGMLDPYED